jgi:hypothetical protein
MFASEDANRERRDAPLQNRQAAEGGLLISETSIRNVTRSDGW